MEQPRKRALGLSSYCTKELIGDHKSKKSFQSFADVRAMNKYFRPGNTLKPRAPQSGTKPVVLTRRKSLAVQFSSLVDERFSQKSSSLRLVACLPGLDKHAKQTPLDFQGSKSPCCSILFLPDLPFSRY